MDKFTPVVYMVGVPAMFAYTRIYIYICIYVQRENRQRIRNRRDKKTRSDRVKDMAKRCTPLSRFFSSTVSECHHWATVLHRTIVLSIECDSGVSSFQVQERSVCLCRVRF